jgi:predicted enzyme related to lactoylglutathione lyase
MLPQNERLRFPSFCENAADGRIAMSQNTVCWVDIPVINLDRAVAFYSAVLGESVRKESSHGVEFGLLPHADSNVSGCLVAIKGTEPSIHGPLVYLSVDGRLDAAIAAVKTSGGSIIQERQPIGPYGHRAIIMDSEGNHIALHSQKP